MKSQKKKFAIVFLGRSGSGKGTQARGLMHFLGSRGHYIETGRLFRSLLEKENPTTKIVHDILKRGGLQPAWLASFLWLREIVEGGHGDTHLVFDGAARRLPEAKLLDEVLAWHARPLALCFYIDVSEKTVTNRMVLRGRADDTATAIKNRMAYFQKDVFPVIRYYRSKNRLIRINGEQSPKEVSAQIHSILEKRFGKNWGKR